MSQQGGGPKLAHVVLALVAAAAVACVIGNAKGHKDGCAATGGTTSGIECKPKEGK